MLRGMLEPGTVFAGEFRVERPIRAGAMGAVYEVTQLSTTRRRALKLMHPDLVRDPVLRERFTREAQVGSRIASEHVVEVIAAGIETGTGEPYLVMELLEGDTLRDHLERRGPLPPAEAAEILRQICHAIGAAHAAMVIHRDLKPENIILARSRRADASFTVKVLDFGIAKIVAEAKSLASSVVGTPMWMAPEQTEVGKPLTAAADVWAIGLIAFRMLTGGSYWLAGRPDADVGELLREIQVEPLVPATERARALGLVEPPPGFDDWFRRSCARDGVARFPNATVAWEALGPVLHASAAARPAPSAGVSATAFGPPVPQAFSQAGPPQGAGLTQVAAPAALVPHAAQARPKPIGVMPFALAGVLLVGGVGGYLALREPDKPAKRERRDADDDDDDRPRKPRSAEAEAAIDKRLPPKATAVKLEIYAMSQCPYAVQLENSLQTVVESLGTDLDLKIDYIGKSDNGTLTSMHGPKEVAGDRVQLCAMKHTPRWFDLILCQNENMKEVDSNWEACADRLSIKKEPISKCLATEGDTLLKESFERALARGARGSPTIYIAGEKYSGGRRAPELMRALCAAHADPKPDACSTIPVSPKVNVTLLSDARCTACDSKKLEVQIKAKVGNPVFTSLDYGSPEGKKLWDSIAPAKLPAAVFDATLDQDTEARSALGKGLRQAGTKQVLEGTSWNPVCADAGGCALPECAADLMCVAEVPRSVHLFMMSKCPFAAKGIVALREVRDNFRNSGAPLGLKVSFIGNEDASGKLTGMHGQREVDENLRHVCAIKHYAQGLKFLDYFECRAKDLKDDDWRRCATSSGLDANKIGSCATSAEGDGLLRASYAESKAAGIGASPTWLANAKYKFSGIDAETIKTKICERNVGMAGCNNKLSGPPPKP